MELTLALDAGAGAAAPALVGPGVDANDPTAEAFAALLATLVAGVVPPAPVVEATASVVDATTTVVGTAPDQPAAPVLPLALALPVAVPVVAEAAEDGADPALPTAATPAPADAPDAPAPAAIPLAPAFPSPIRPESGQQRDQNVDLDVDVPVRAERPTTSTPVPTPTATVTPEAVAPVAGPPSSSPSAREGQADGDQGAPTAPIATAPAVREVLRPEIVSGPGAPKPAPPTPVEQVVRAVAPLRKLPDGTHHVTLELRPADLGVVRVELSLDHGMIHLGLQADTEGTSQLLRAALPELRAQLDTAGLLAGRLAVDDGQFGRDTQGQPSWRADADARRARRDEAETPPEDPAPTAYSSSAYGQIDVLL